MRIALTRLAVGKQSNSFVSAGGTSRSVFEQIESYFRVGVKDLRKEVFFSLSDSADDVSVLLLDSA